MKKIFQAEKEMEKEKNLMNMVNYYLKGIFKWKKVELERKRISLEWKNKIRRRIFEWEKKRKRKSV